MTAPPRHPTTIRTLSGTISLPALREGAAAPVAVMPNRSGPVRPGRGG